jgi:hypothetical protein
VLSHITVESKAEARMRAALRVKMARILYKNDTIQNETIFHSLTTAIFENRHVRTGTAKQWTFPGAFYFSTLVVTLIGKFSMSRISNKSYLFRLWTYNAKDRYIFDLFIFDKRTFLLVFLVGGKIFCMVYTVAGV